jgi:hypothetical protein
LAEAFDQIRQNAEGNVAVLTRQLQTLEIIAGQTANTRRRQSLRQQADLIAAVAERTIPSPHDGAGVKAASVRLDSFAEPRSIRKNDCAAPFFLEQFPTRSVRRMSAVSRPRKNLACPCLSRDATYDQQC